MTVHFSVPTLGQSSQMRAMALSHTPVFPYTEHTHDKTTLGPAHIISLAFKLLLCNDTLLFSAAPVIISGNSRLGYNFFHSHQLLC